MTDPELMGDLAIMRLLTPRKGSSDPRAFVRTHLPLFAKRRERAYYSHRAFTTCAVSSVGKVKSSTSALVVRVQHALLW